jgi:hypothetical protein
MNRFIIPGKAALIALFLIMSSNQHIRAQEDCALKLQEAQAQYERGRVEQVTGLLQPCLSSGGFSREEEVTAYKLLIQALIMDEELEAADETMLEFLRRFPEYSVTAADYPGFTYLRNKFRVTPLLLLSFRAGLNYTFLTGRDEQSLSSLPPDIKYSREPLNFTASTEVSLPVTGRLSVAAGIGYSSSSFLYNENMMNFGDVTYRESQKRIEIPVSAIYEIGRFGNVLLYGRAGAGYAINISVDAKASFIPSDINNAYTRTGENLDRKSSRIGSELFLLAGAGGMFKIPHGYLSAEIRTLLGTRNQVIRSDAGNLEYYYFYSDDDFRLNLARITIGYTYIFYKPSKVTGL